MIARVAATVISNSVGLRSHDSVINPIMTTASPQVDESDDPKVYLLSLLREIDTELEMWLLRGTEFMQERSQSTPCAENAGRIFKASPRVGD